MKNGFLILVAGLALSACGGGGPTGGNAAAYAGRFVGTYVEGTGGGAAELNIATAGDVTGALTPTGGIGPETVSGRVSSGGTLSARVQPPGRSPETLTGRLTVDASGRMTGDLTRNSIAGASTVTIDLMRQ